jgi:hypothetical protein
MGGTERLHWWQHGAEPGFRQGLRLAMLVQTGRGSFRHVDISIILLERTSCPWTSHRLRAHHLDTFYSQHLTARALGHHRKDSKFLPWPPPRAISRQASDLRATRHPPSRLIGIVAAASLSKHTYLPMMATLRRICELSAHSHHFPRLQQRILARTRSWPLFPAPLQHIQDQVESATSATLVS